MAYDPYQIQRIWASGRVMAASHIAFPAPVRACTKRVSTDTSAVQNDVGAKHDLSSAFVPLRPSTLSVMDRQKSTSSPTDSVITGRFPGLRKALERFITLLKKVLTS